MILVSCVAQDGSGGAETATGTDALDGGDGTSGGDPGLDHDTALDTSDDCPAGVVCIDTFPWVGSGDTRLGVSEIDSYACAWDTDESGPELIYRVTLPEGGYLGAVVEDADEVDVDVHILGSLDPEDCLDRGHHDASAHLDAGTYWVVVDSWSDGSGDALAGPFELTVGHTVPNPGDCAMEEGWMDRVGDGGDLLAMPATGPVVMEAHLVTVDDGYGTAGSGPWPATQTEGLDVHYAVSFAATGFVLYRDQVWAPQESSRYGQGAHYQKLPVEDEAWYVNMYWEDRPEPGTRMILQHPDGRAVVVSAGFETGPGNLDHIGGTTEEVHRYLGTGHLSVLTLGLAVDQHLPLGPIACR